MATTPPPPSVLRIPPSPRYGAGYDQYEPYSTRHSARIADQRVSRDSTPPPRFASFQPAAGSKSPKKERNNHDEPEALSPPGSIPGSPRKKPSGRGRAFAPTHSLEEDTMGLTDPFTLRAPSSKQPPPVFEATRTNGMLPTPAKTPKKKAVGDAGATARTLFPPMSGRPKKSKKHTGFSLDSFNDDPVQSQNQIAIYTDSRDRIPEVDESEENPFYKPKEARAAQTPGNPLPPRCSGRRKVVEDRMERKLKRDQEVSDAVKRDDGMVYVFRGKRMFRKFNDQVESDGEDDDDLGLLAGRPDLIDSPLTASVRPLTRSSIKPRVLFPSAKDSRPQQDPSREIDEEAATDIEDPAKDTDDADQTVDEEMQPSTPPQKSTAAVPSSPSASATRSLRPRAKRDDVDHETTPTVSEPKRKRVSPFDGWLRKKQTPAATGPKSKKREAEAVGSPGGPSTKRPRGSRAAASSS